MMTLRWLIVLPQIAVVCAVDHTLDLMFSRRKAGKLVIDLDRCLAWIEKPPSTKPSTRSRFPNNPTLW